MIYPIIMAGGSGTRFWPRSRLIRPKQLISVVGKGTMIQQTLERLKRDFPPQSAMILTNAAQVGPTRAQLPEVPPERVIGEPAGRDTAACIGLAAMMLKRSDPNAIMAVLAADQIIGDSTHFLDCIHEAARLAESAHLLVTLGIFPDHPSDQYGYLLRGERISGPAGAPPSFHLKKFVEKPDKSKAAEFLKAGGYYWNSGNFVWRAADILAAMERYLPEHFAILRRIEGALGTKDEQAVLAREYPLIPKLSIDYGVMEKVPDAAVVETRVDWDDVGSWNALARHQKPDNAGNVAAALHAGIDTRNCIVAAEDGHLVATVGVDNLIIVQTPDATLICRRDRAADVKALVALLRERGLEGYL